MHLDLQEAVVEILVVKVALQQTPVKTTVQFRATCTVEETTGNRGTTNFHLPGKVLVVLPQRKPTEQLDHVVIRPIPFALVFRMTVSRIST
jgi:hypothetical protein